MRNLPYSLVIALWLTASTWLVAFLIYEFGIDRHVLYATFVLGFAAAFVEGGASRRS